MLRELLHASIAVGLSTSSLAQSLPSELYLSEDGHMLHTGGQPSTGLYEKSVVRTLDLQFEQANYWTLLTQNYDSQTDIRATLTVDGEVYDSIGVRFKGQTSYSMLPQGAQKKSFNLTMDHEIDGQDLMGYGTLNLNNAFQDASFLREVVYLDLIRDHVPAAKANFVHLNINGENWGVYPNVQQINSDFVKEWFFSNDGTLWRADRPPGSGGGPGGGGMWGDGTAALNDLGPDTTDYQQYYTLKRTERVNPWDDLVRVCGKLNGLPLSELADSLDKYIDVDRTLWFLASEIAFGDDDGYVHKGKMDYYLYYDVETGRITPQEFDGNSVMKNNVVNWSPFYHADNENYPLLERLLAVPELRQRYLAHLRTLITEKMQSGSFNALLSSWSTLIDAEVNADPKKLYTYAAFNTELIALQNFITNRRNNLLGNAEVAQLAPVVTGLMHRVGGEDWAAPDATTGVQVVATVANAATTARVDLFYSLGIHGGFTAVQLFDDGAHADGAAGDGTFGGNIPAAPAMTRVRYYVQAKANNTANSVSYAPPGAEHDVNTYLVRVGFAADPAVRINELMAQNTSTALDENDQYEDWIELYNTSAEAMDLSGGWLSDDPMNVFKWRFPAGSLIPPDGYMIVWADEDGGQGERHANFKLAASGEEVWLTGADGLVLDHVEFAAQQANMGYARIPNGTGPFVEQDPTFAVNNEINTSLSEPVRVGLDVYPNPASGSLTINVSEPIALEVFDPLQRSVWSGTVAGRSQLDLGGWAAGAYTIRHPGGAVKVVVVH
ncbi:MAG: CotH kinase family protein [Flavobacteriales bacterium]|nr:CotH kinase family protein [Flavobacteriales bacterium]